jgi:GH15 family glucan-1,4-alpha-glucosidase
MPHVLREYAFVADGERGAVVGPSGGIEWLCFPHWHDGGVFSSLVGGHGEYVVRPQGRYVWGGSYDDGTLIWRIRWVTADGSVVECRDALHLPGRCDAAVLLRRVEVLTGSVRLDVVCNPRPDYGRAPVRAWHDDGSTHTGSAAGVHVRWTAPCRTRDEPDEHGGRRLVGEISLGEGECADLVLELATGPFSDPPADPAAAWSETAAAWKRDVPELGPMAGARDARHACAVLRGLTGGHGAMVAAATASLPERADTGRDYDYRFAWIRDLAMAGQSMAVAAPDSPLLDRWTGFVVERLLADGDRMSPAYTVEGAPIPVPSHLGLPGYPGGHDVVGNQVRDQFQLDAFGDALLLLADMGRLDRLDAEGWRAADMAADAIAARWQQPDSGIWELQPRWWTNSRLTCVAGLRAMANVAGDGELVQRWAGLADLILAETSRRCVHPSGRFQRAEDDERVDAALLLPLVRGCLGPEDPRIRQTVAAVRRELCVDGYVYRYRPDARPLGEAEGAFLLCGFVMSLAELALGDPVSSARWFERTRASCGPPGLFSEEYDVAQRQLRGNLPQAFVHGMLLQAAACQPHDAS